jgi:hypothetical protein
VTLDAARASFALFSRNAETMDSMRGSGSIEFGQNGVHASLSFDIDWRGDSSFVIEFSGPLGMTMASVRSGGVGRSTWIVTAADSSYDVLPDRPISIGRDFVEYPLSWSEFLSLVTGRLPCVSVFSRAPDSSRMEKNSVTLLWKSERCGRRVMDISGNIDNKTLGLSEITYKEAERGAWSFSAAKFIGRRAKEYRFAQANNNYFYLKYHSANFHLGAGKRVTF